MLLLRTASGSFIRAESIVALSPHRDGDGEITWAAVRADGSQVELAGFYGAPGRIEKTLPDLLLAPAAASHAYTAAAPEEAAGATHSARPAAARPFRRRR